MKCLVMTPRAMWRLGLRRTLERALGCDVLECDGLSHLSREFVAAGAPEVVLLDAAHYESALADASGGVAADLGKRVVVALVDSHGQTPPPWADAALPYDVNPGAVIRCLRQLCRIESTTVGLTEREFDIVHLVSQGQSNREIAAHLHISLNTVKTHVTNITRKLSVTTRTGILQWWIGV